MLFQHNNQSHVVLTLSTSLDLFYSYVFSFDKILNDLETGQAIVSCLIGIDCQEQMESHMKGMIYNGASKEEVETIQNICLRVVERLGVKPRTGPVSVPDIED